MLVLPEFPAAMRFRSNVAATSYSTLKLVDAVAQVMRPDDWYARQLATQPVEDWPKIVGGYVTSRLGARLRQLQRVRLFCRTDFQLSKPFEVDLSELEEFQGYEVEDEDEECPSMVVEAHRPVADHQGEAGRVGVAERCVPGGAPGDPLWLDIMVYPHITRVRLMPAYDRMQRMRPGLGEWMLDCIRTIGSRTVPVLDHSTAIDKIEKLCWAWEGDETGMLQELMASGLSHQEAMESIGITLEDVIKGFASRATAYLKRRASKSRSRAVKPFAVLNDDEALDFARSRRTGVRRSVAMLIERLLMLKQRQWPKLTLVYPECESVSNFAVALDGRTPDLMDTLLWKMEEADNQNQHVELIAQSFVNLSEHGALAAALTSFEAWLDAVVDFDGLLMAIEAAN